MVFLYYSVLSFCDLGSSVQFSWFSLWFLIFSDTGFTCCTQQHLTVGYMRLVMLMSICHCWCVCGTCAEWSRPMMDSTGLLGNRLPVQKKYTLTAKSAGWQLVERHHPELLVMTQFNSSLVSSPVSLTELCDDAMMSWCQHASRTYCCTSAAWQLKLVRVLWVKL